MIDRARGADQQLAERYLAGQLSPDETREFEEAMLERPELLEQVELARTVKLGLRTLRERGQLESLVRAKPRTRQFWFAAAAATLLAVTGFLLLREHQVPVILASSLGELGPLGNTRFVSGEYMVVRTRGQGTLTLSATTAQPVLALRLLLSSSGERQLNRVELLRSGVQMATLEAVRSGDYLPIYIDTSALESGEYALRVSTIDGATPVVLHRLRLVLDGS